MQLGCRFMGLAVSMMSDAAWRDVLRAEEAASFARTLRCAWVSGFIIWLGLEFLNICWSFHKLCNFLVHSHCATANCLFTRRIWEALQAGQYAKQCSPAALMAALENSPVLCAYGLIRSGSALPAAAGVAAQGSGG